MVGSNAANESKTTCSYVLAVGPGMSLSGGVSVCLLLSPGKPGDRDSPEQGGDSFEGSDSLLQSWSSQSSLLEQRVPSFESCEDDGSQALGLSKPTMSFKDYIQERSDPAEQGKPVIPAAVLAGFTGECAALGVRPLPVPARLSRVCLSRVVLV